VMKDGRVYERYGAPVFSGKERLGWVWTFHEITARKQAERSILEAQHELESKVAARTRDLKDMNSLLLQQITERERAEGERLELLKRLFTVQEDERGRIARDIHDQLGQRVTALRMGIAQVKSFCSDGDRLDQQIERLEQLAAQLDEEVSFVSWELRPSALDSGDFAKSLGSYVNEWSRYSGIKAKFHSAEIDSSDLDTNVQTNLYRITQEALNNASKHSAAERVNVLLERRGDTLVLIIEDNGVGFDVEDMPRERDLNRGFGTVGMRERASLIGGTFEIESETGKGTTVIVRVPLQQHRI
jgi:signal transduction histidine kinase